MIANPNDGNSPRVEVATPMIDVSAGGLITATTEQEKGYVSGGTKSATQQLTTQGAKTVTPTTTNQTAVASGRYTTGAVTVAGDANLVPENIAEGVSIFGVTGTHSGGGGGDREQISITVKGNTFVPLNYRVASNGSVLKASAETTITITADINSILLFGSHYHTPTVTAVSSGEVTNIDDFLGSSGNYMAVMANCNIEVT
uniref:hypothetical protein n=1 Tax=Candidatus Scatomorpha intestinigallinarum TaxID=2840923 RepID=UPI004029A87B